MVYVLNRCSNRQLMKAKNDLKTGNNLNLGCPSVTV